MTVPTLPTGGYVRAHPFLCVHVCVLILRKDISLFWIIFFYFDVAVGRTIFLTPSSQKCNYGCLAKSMMHDKQPLVLFRLVLDSNTHAIFRLIFPKKMCALGSSKYGITWRCIIVVPRCHTCYMWRVVGLVCLPLYQHLPLMSLGAPLDTLCSLPVHCWKEIIPRTKLWLPFA